MNLKRLGRMLWWREVASVGAFLLTVALGVYLLASHANTQLWSFVGVILILDAYVLASTALLRAAADKPPDDLRGILRILALVSFVAGLLIFSYALLSHLPSLG